MDNTHDQELALLARLRCLACGGALDYAARAEADAQARCRQCGASYPRVVGVWRMLTPAQTAHYQAFIAGYRDLRTREGWERPTAYYLSLPYVKSDDPAAAIWRIRQRSFARLQRVAEPGGGRWALDLGAGNGWLARHLTRWGYCAVALDLNAPGVEGLEGGQLYLDHDGIWFGRVHAAMDALPFAEGSFALCTVSGALHYADLRATLAAVARVLAPSGTLAITDSPVYRQAAAGQAMAAEQRARARTYLGHEPEALPGGPGFLPEGELRAALAAAGFTLDLLSIERPLGRLRRSVRRLVAPGRREEARFPVIVARKAGEPPA